MRGIGMGGFLLYAAVLAVLDGKKKEIPLLLPAAGALAGLLLRAADLINGTLTPRELLYFYAPGLLFGLMLLIIARLCRGAVGKGDGLCFLSFAFWEESGFLFSLLLISVFLLAVSGLIWILAKKKDRRTSLPLMPFVLLTALGLYAAELLQGALP